VPGFLLSSEFLSESHGVTFKNLRNRVFMTVEPFTKRGNTVNLFLLFLQHQPRVRGACVVFGGGLHGPLLSSRIVTAIRLERQFSQLVV
jgi:hypothetical protein